jgi:hypothetical protein
MSGEELANISKLLGHSSLATTTDFNDHLTPGISRRTADRMAPPWRVEAARSRLVRRLSKLWL